MKKHGSIIGILFLLFVTSLSGCTQQTNTDADKFIGTWITDIKVNPMSGDNYTETRIFYDNNTYVTTNLGIGHIPGSWRLSDNRLIIDTVYPGTYEYFFSENNTVLQLTSISTGYTENLTKQP